MDVGTITLVGVVVLVVMVVIFLKVRQKDLIGAMMQKRRNPPAYGAANWRVTARRTHSNK